MTPDEIKVLAIVLTVVILGSGWILALKVRHHFRMRALAAQREVERELISSRSRDPQPNEIWKWPSRSHGVPGVWGGPTEALERFLTHLRTIEHFEDLPERRQREILAMPKATRFGYLYGAWRRH